MKPGRLNPVGHVVCPPPAEVLHGVRGAMSGECVRQAWKLGHEAAAEGFDWTHAEELFGKLAEEVAELRQEVVARDPDRERMLDELGDVLFCVVNLSRKLDLDPVAALALANDKFRRRYGHVRAHLDGYPPIGDPARLAAMEARWCEAKAQERAAGAAAPAVRPLPDRGV